MDGVLADQISHTHTTPLGPSLVAWQAWQRLGLPALLGNLGFNAAQEQAAATSVINRLIDPGSELALVDWLPDRSLPELMAREIGPAGKDRFYRVSDQLFEHRQAIEEHLRQRQGQLFETDRTLLLYDLTNSYFEGEALGNPKAKRGKSKEKRSDCPQIVLGMVFDRRGFELAHRVFEGNQSDGNNQIERRVEGHIWITILAYHLLSWIQETLREAGDQRRWATIRRVLQTHCYTAIVVPTKDGKTYRLRKAGEPEELQKTIYRKLNVNWQGLPQTKLVVESGAIL